MITVKKWGGLKVLVNTLLAGDHQIPSKTPDAGIVLLEYALSECADLADALLLTRELEQDEPLLGQCQTTMNKRHGFDNEIVRHAILPTRDDDEIEIDRDLIFPVARLMASYISKEKMAYHRSKAEELLGRYNAKTYSLREISDGALK